MSITTLFPQAAEIPAEFAQQRLLEQRDYLLNGELVSWPGELSPVISPVQLRHGDTLTPVLLGYTPLLDAKGRPMPTERAWIVPPASRIGPATDAERQALRQGSPMSAKYDKAIDRESAYEVLAGRAAAPADQAPGRPRPRQRRGARRPRSRAVVSWTA